jgi:hypothetical protein
MRTILVCAPYLIKHGSYFVPPSVMKKKRLKTMTPERLKILEKLQKLEEEEKEGIDKNEKEKYLAGILKIPQLGDSIDRFSEYFGLNSFETGLSGK